MPTRNVVVTDRQATLIDTLVASGRYQNASDVLRDGLRMLEAHHLEASARLDALRAAAQSGLNALECGQFQDFADADSLRTHLTQLATTVLPASAANR